MNMAEIMEALLTGKKLTRSCWQAHEYIQIINGDLMNEVADPCLTMVLGYTDFILYHEPELNLGPEHVGRRVKLRNGCTVLITVYNPVAAENNHGPLIANDLYYQVSGALHGTENSQYDIVELLP